MRCPCRNDCKKTKETIGGCFIFKRKIGDLQMKKSLFENGICNGDTIYIDAVYPSCIYSYRYHHFHNLFTSI